MMSTLKTRILHYLELLATEERFDEEQGLWLFADGGHCSICTDSARRIAKQFNGRVVGYYSRDNPMARIGIPAVKGHDFALIDDRWLVDYWAWRVARVAPKAILDLSRAADSASAYFLYGPKNLWEHVELTQVPSIRIA